jgi:hypothetical protein
VDLFEAGEDSVVNGFSSGAPRDSEELLSIFLLIRIEVDDSFGSNEESRQNSGRLESMHTLQGLLSDIVDAIQHIRRKGADSVHSTPTRDTHIATAVC